MLPFFWKGYRTYQENEKRLMLQDRMLTEKIYKEQIQTVMVTEQRMVKNKRALKYQ